MNTAYYGGDRSSSVIGPKGIAKLVGGVILFILLLAFLFGSFGTVGAGERGIRLRFGAVAGQVGEGLYFKLPFVERVVKMDVKVHKEEVAASAASKDLQTVSSVVALNFHLNPNSAARVYQEIGIEYKTRLIDPVIQESVKATTAKYTAEELISKREDVRMAIEAHIRERLNPEFVTIDGFNIVNFDFSKSFNDAIEAKVTAQQNALAAQNKLQQVQFEADQAREIAKGKADALLIESNALKSAPNVLELRALEKWDGVLPQVMGGNAVPFVNIPR